MQPDPTNAKPAVAGGFARKHAAVKSRANVNAAAVQTSSRPRRCPWFAEVVERAARPGPWHSTAIVHAGSGAWERARETHDIGRRACTVLPPGTDPAAIAWPPVRCWIGDTGDLPTAAALELARCLIDCGADRVHLIGEHIRPALAMRRAR